MAKKKRSTALFEVITQGRQPSPLQIKKPIALLMSPRGWFKRWRSSEPPAELGSGPASVSPAAQAAAAMPSAPIAVVRRIIVEEPAAALPGGTNVDHQIVVATSQELGGALANDVEPATSSQFAHESDANDGDGYTDILTTPRAQSVAVAVDPERRQISLRMSYTAAIVGAFAILVVVGLSIIVGQHMSRSSVPLLAQTTTKKLRQGEPRREVLDPVRRNNNGFPLPGNPNSAPPTNRAPVTANDNRTGPNTGTEAATAAPAPGDEKRTYGLNYVIIQSYPKEEEKMAIEAAKFLNKEGISCTIETKVRGYLPITVVGLQGFERATSTEMKAYEQRILQASAKYAGTTRSFKAFAPAIKKWVQID
jgi:hypothetical protein